MVQADRSPQRVIAAPPAQSLALARSQRSENWPSTAQKSDKRRGDVGAALGGLVAAGKGIVDVDRPATLGASHSSEWPSRSQPGR